MQRHTEILRIGAILVLCLAIATTGTTRHPDFPEHMPSVERTFPEDPHKFSFAIIGDKTGGGLDKWPVFNRAIDEINALKPDFAIMVGDLIQGNTTDVEQLATEWREFWQHQSDLTIPFLPLPGNHDITNPVMYNYWIDNIGPTYSTFAYKNCLFLLLNTEEWHNPAMSTDLDQDSWFGTTQISYLKAALARHNDVRHTFVFLHRPAWLHEDSGWTKIEEMLEGRAYTVFAGHYHTLTLHTRNDRRYFVLGATGAGFTPQKPREYGAFDHYSLVTVEAAEVNVAIIEPGNIYPADISTAAFKERLTDLMTFTPRYDFSSSSGRLEIAIENRLEKPVTLEIAFQPNEQWIISPHRLTFRAEPGHTTNASITLGPLAETLVPLPIYDYALFYDGEQLANGNKLFHPIDRAAMHTLKNWMLLGPFDLDIRLASIPLNQVPPRFLQIQPPTYDTDKTYHGQNGDISWKEIHSETERLDLDAAFGKPEHAFGYGTTYIKSPSARHVFAQIGWGSDWGRLFLNGAEISKAAAPGEHLFYGWAHFELPLQAGWNSLTVESADYTGRWDYRMEIADPTNTLQFNTRPDNTATAP